jgi:hypothetical protein
MSLTKVSYSMINGAPVNVLDFGADPTGVADSAVAIQAAHAAAVANNFSAVCFPPGIYQVNTGLEWSPFITASTTGRVVINTALTTGRLFHISAEYGYKTTAQGQQSKSVFKGTFTFIATQNANSCTAMYFGTDDTDALKMAWGIDVSNVTTQNFLAAITFANVSFLVKFYNCDFLGSYDDTQQLSTFGINQPVQITNSGENISFYGCVFEHLNFAIADNTGTLGNYLGITFYACSFDYNNSLTSGTPSQGVYTFNGCHFEWPGEQTYFNIVGATINCRDCTVYVPPGGVFATPLFAGITNIGSSINGRLNISGTKWILPVGCPGLIFLASVNSFAVVESQPDFTLGNTPAYYLSNVFNANVQYNTVTKVKGYTVIWGSTGTQPVLGNGSIVGHYNQIANVVSLEISLTMGSTTTFGTGGYIFSLPIQAANKGVSYVGSWMGDNFGVQQEFGLARIDINATGVLLFAPIGTAVVSNVTNTVPHTWKDQDTIKLSIQYECVMP